MNSILTDLPPDSFVRADDTDDTIFYAKDRMVDHLDSLALQTIENLVGRLVVDDSPAILDLMASCDSHIPNSVKASRIVGLGLNERELASNTVLDEYVIHDVNKSPALPFEDETFDVVLNTVSVDYMTQPVSLFTEIGRILKPGGLFLVMFSNRYFQAKVVKVWRHATGTQRIQLVELFFDDSEQFEDPTVFVSRGKPRPEHDKYAPLGVSSDPVCAVHAEKKGVFGSTRPKISASYADRPFDLAEVEARKQHLQTTLQCPYCGDRLKKLEVPDTPFTEWPSDYLYVCLFDECPYFLFGWDAMADQGSTGSYRLMYEPTIGNCYSIPVMNREDLKDQVLQDA